MVARKQKNTSSSEDPWDAPVRGTSSRGPTESETTKIPVEIIDDLVEVLSAESDLDPEPDLDAEGPSKLEERSRDPRDLYISDLEARLAETSELLEQTRAAYRKREKELTAARERLERDREKHLERSRVALLERLLEPLGNLDRSVSSASGWSRKDDRTEGLLGGLDMIRNQLHDRLEELGLVRFDPTGETFDPTLHEALSANPVADKAMIGKVIEVWEPGYRCGEVVIQAAKVVVGRQA